MKTSFLTTWDNKQTAQVEKQIKKYLNSRFFEYSQGYTSDLYNSLGLAYTSSSSYAGLWICNIELYFDCEQKYKFIGFALGSGGFVFAICWDNEENEIIFPIN
jgi:hypothetical protein